MRTGWPGELKAAFLDLVRLQLRRNSDCHFIGFDVSRHQLEVPNGAERICDMPISEESVLAAAVGMSRAGSEVFVDLMFEAFAYRTMDVLVNQMALSALFSAASRAPITVRMICGPFEGAGPQHGSAGYALLARIPHLLVAAPCLAPDVSLAYDVAKQQGRPLLLLMGEGLSAEVGASSLPDGSQLRVWGSGAKLGIVCWGLHVRLVTEAIKVAEAFGDTRVITPLFLAPLPLDQILNEVRMTENLLIIDGPSSPATLGDLLAFKLNASAKRGRTLHYSLWEDNVGARFDERLCIQSLVAKLEEVLRGREDNHGNGQ
jgi:pyruvate/2-oxoglutarate/acetoin dehydrogenase E1 component